MLDNIGTKLFGSEDERAVSPVIGVILMVAITVILAAVIAAFVLDLGDSIEEDPRAAVNIDDSNQSEVQVSVTSLDNADGVAIVNGTGDVIDDADGDGILDSTGASVTVGSSSADVESDGRHTVQAYFGDLEAGDPINDAQGSAVIGEFESSS